MHIRVFTIMLTFLAGLDDYPRAFPAHPSEIHVDLLSWMAFMSSSLKTIAMEIGESSDVAKFERQYQNMLKSLDGNC